MDVNEDNELKKMLHDIQTKMEWEKQNHKTEDEMENQFKQEIRHKMMNLFECEEKLTHQIQELQAKQKYLRCKQENVHKLMNLFEREKKLTHQIKELQAKQKVIINTFEEQLKANHENVKKTCKNLKENMDVLIQVHNNYNIFLTNLFDNLKADIETVYL